MNTLEKEPKYRSAARKKPSPKSPFPPLPNFPSGPPYPPPFRFGEGIYQYFDFIFFCIITNIFMLVLGLGSLVPHFIIDGWQVPSNATGVDILPLGIQENFYTSSYSPRLYWVRPTPPSPSFPLPFHSPASL